MHGLDPESGSVPLKIAFTLPPLQGHTIDQHFHRIGVRSGRTRSGLAIDLIEAKLPSPPDQWQIQAERTNYYYRPDGSTFKPQRACRVPLP